ncbi:MAG TPA: glycogen synthase [Longimicrobiales bacterium]|nr:glycogen synthase [Longimicrobiales bacterium]
MKPDRNPLHVVSVREYLVPRSTAQARCIMSRIFPAGTRLGDCNASHHVAAPEPARVTIRIAILTNEYPPNVYGGAGVHVDYLTRELAALDGGRHHVQVLSFGAQRESGASLSVEGVQPPVDIAAQDPRHAKVFATLLQDLVMSGRLADIDVVHCHTWYTHFAGCLAKHLHGVPLILTTHSLEPHRPWKVEQLGTAYHVSSWIERTAYENADGVVAVSQSMLRDVHALYNVPLERIRVIHNGIDLDEYRPAPNVDTLREWGIDPGVPFVLFVGRITRQKGIIHLVNAIQHIQPGVQVVLCAGAPDTPEITREMVDAVERARAESTHRIIWIDQMLSKEKTIHLYTHAEIFVCPSIYEPFGIINLEAMACGTPVVASAVGGIPEVVEHGGTGLLVAPEAISATEVEPRHPEQFARDLATAINSLLADPELCETMARNARERVEQRFSWRSIARQTLEFYEEVCERHAQGRAPEGTRTYTNLFEPPQ